MQFAASTAVISPDISLATANPAKESNTHTMTRNDVTVFISIPLFLPALRFFRRLSSLSGYHRFPGRQGTLNKDTRVTKRVSSGKCDSQGEDVFASLQARATKSGCIVRVKSHPPGTGPPENRYLPGANSEAFLIRGKVTSGNKRCRLYGREKCAPPYPQRGFFSFFLNFVPKYARTAVHWQCLFLLKIMSR
jgi:hypothetical protein